LRQIQRQSRGPEQLLKDPKIQRLLKLDDEQMMKIEKALKESSPHGLLYTTRLHLAEPILSFETTPYLNSIFLGGSDLNPKMLAKVAEVLTEEQRRALRTWLGEPFRDASWNWLWPQDAGKKGR
jgi:hypothetical protein